ncbi:MAG: TIGR02556 family CRISPR-associated protein [Caldisericia bacterium]|nr:TIGR02556 family CRISPR-associated protein [Caldisericia bacterium]
MIDAIRELGKIIMEKENVNELNSLLEDPNSTGKYRVIFTITFTKNTDNWYFEDVEMEEYDKDKNLKYLYRSGPSNAPNYSPSAKLTDIDRTYPLKIKGWFKKILSKENLLNDEEKKFIENIYSLLENSENLIIEKIRKFREETPKKEGIFITLKFKENNTVKYLGDIKVFENILIQTITEEENIKGFNNGVCSICKEEKPVIIGDGIYTFFTIDKTGFISGGLKEENAWKNFPICQTCKRNIEKGKEYLETNLTFKFAGLTYQLIPKFIIGREFVSSEVIDIFTNASKIFKLKENVQKKYLGEENEILGYLKEYEDYLTLNFLFIQKMNKAERILSLIEDVFPSHLKQLFSVKEEVDLLYNKDFTFKTIWNFFSKSDQNKRDADLKAYFLDLSDRIFKGKPVDFSFVLKFLMKRIRTSFVNDDYFNFTVLDAIMIVSFLQKLDLINMEVFNMEERIFSELFEKFKPTFESPLKRGLFLLGGLTQLLLNTQYSRRESTPPFLKQLKGLKMDEKDFKGLIPKIQNKLYEYDAFDKGKQKLAEEASYYLLIAGNNWKMSIDEMNFYFATGMNLINDITKIIYPEKKSSGEKQN